MIALKDDSKVIVGGTWLFIFFMYIMIIIQMNIWMSPSCFGWLLYNVFYLAEGVEPCLGNEVEWLLK